MEYNGKMPSIANTSDSSVIIQLQDISDAKYEILLWWKLQHKYLESGKLK